MRRVGGVHVMVPSTNLRDGAFHKSKKLGGFKNWSKLYLAYQLAGCNKFFRNEMVNGAKEFCKSNRNIGRIFKVVDDDVG